MKLPRVAQIRQLQAQNRQKHMEDNASRANADDRNSMFAKHHQNQRHAYGQAPRFSMTNRPTRDRNAGVISSREWEEAVSKYDDSGKGFRRFFYGFVLFALVLLAFAKYDVEVNLEVPQIESGRGFGEVVADDDIPDSSDNNAGDNANSRPSNGASKLSDREMRELDEMYNLLGVKGRLKQKRAQPSKPAATTNPDTSGDAAATAPPTPAADPDKERRRENYRVRQELKNAYESHQEGLGQLVHCGRACESKNQQVELAYTTLASQIDRELYGVLLDSKNTKEKRGASQAELREFYETKKAEIVASDENEEDRNMALEELRDAYEILANPEAKAYYHLYGRKPPAIMKHASARHGGWGQEVQLGSFKYRLIFSWLDYFDSSWGEIVVLGAIAVFILMRLPQALQQTQRLVEELEWEDRISAQEADAAKAEGAASE
jgi:hypothetical protein